MADQRIDELRRWEQETGQKLPLTAEEIVYLEDQGNMVDLETGELLDNPAEGEEVFDEELEILGL